MAALLKGADELRRKMRGGKLALEILPAAGQHLRMRATGVLQAAQADVPFEDGELRNSAFVDGPKVRKSRYSVTVTAGYTAAHAPYVHEGVHGHARKRDDRKPKWLAKTVDGNAEEQLAQEMGDLVMSELSKVLK